MQDLSIAPGFAYPIDDTEPTTFRAAVGRAVEADYLYTPGGNQFTTKDESVDLGAVPQGSMTVWGTALDSLASYI